MRPRRRPRHAVCAPPCRLLPAPPQAPVAAAATAPGIGCVRWARGWRAARACVCASGARGRTPPRMSGGGAGDAARPSLHGTMPSAPCALVPSGHRWRRAACALNAPIGTSDRAPNCSETRVRRKRGKSVERTSRDHGEHRDGLRAPTWCGRSARRRPPECRIPAASGARRRPTPSRAAPSAVFTLVSDTTKNAYRFLHIIREVTLE